MSVKLLFGGAMALAMLASGAASARPQMSTAADSPAAAALPTPDYITAAAQSDEFETTEGRMAAKMGASAKVRAFGQMMVHDHAMTTKTLMAAASKSGMTPTPPPLSADQQQMVSQLQGMTGADFDKTYVTQQVQAHQMALMVHSGYAKGGTDRNLRKAAKAAVPIVKKHLAEATDMQNGM